MRDGIFTHLLSVTGQYMLPGLFVLLGCYFFVHAIRNVYFHPLSNCPGPFLAKFSTIPSYYHSRKGDRHIWIWQCFQIYGDKIRIEPNTVLFLDPAAYRDVYGPKANVQRCNTYLAWSRNGNEFNTISTVAPAAHGRKRKMLNQAFTDKAIKNAASFISQHVDRWIGLISQTADGEIWTESRNMATWNDWLVFDILGDLCFGRSFDIKEPGPNPIRDIPNHIVNYCRFFYPITHSSFVDFIVWAKPRGLDRLMEFITPVEIRQYYQFINDNISRRIEEERSAKDGEQPRLDMIHFLYKAQDPDTEQPAYTEEALRAETLLLTIAGSDSIANTLSAFWFYISRNASAYSSLVNEIRTTFSSLDEIRGGQKLASCTYLHACLDETLRMATPAPSEFGREVLPGGTTINGEFFPAGVVVGCSSWSMARNDRVFGDVNRFRPERWIPSEARGVTTEDVKQIRSTFNPFLIGPTSCAGKTLAITELSLIVARTLFQLDLRAVPGEDIGAGHASLGWGRREKNVFQVVDAFISVRDGPIVQFRRVQ